MERLKQILSEAKVQEQNENGRKEIAYYRYLAAAFGVSDLMAKIFAFPDRKSGNNEDFSKFCRILQHSLYKAEELLDFVLEYTGDDLEEIRGSGSQIAGRGAEPMIIDPREIFPITVESSKKAPNTGLDDQNENPPMLMESRLTLNLYAHHYHLQLLMQKVAELENLPAKEQANAIFLASAMHAFNDMIKLLKRCMELELDIQKVEEIEFRNEFMTIDKIAGEINLINKMFWARLNKDDIQSRELQAQGTAKALVDYRNFLVRFAQYEILRNRGQREKAECIVFLVKIAERLIEKFGDYAAAESIIQGVTSKLVISQSETTALLRQPTVIKMEALAKSLEHKRCRDQVLKHPHPIPPISLLLEEVRHDHYGLSKDSIKLIDRVIRNCKENLHSKRPDIQHWLLSRPYVSESELICLNQSKAPGTENHSGQSPAYSPESIREPAAIQKSDLRYVDPAIPGPRKQDLEAIAAVDDDQYDLILVGLKSS